MAVAQRKLAAIVAMDVAGYSRLMGRDEQGTLARLKQHRAIVDPISEAHGGRIVGSAGDGVLAEFPSVVEAVSFALRAQAALAEGNAGLPDDEKMLMRVGINLGDVLVDGDQIYGDGVNVAARLEALAKPGGICISRAARDQVRDKLDVRFADMGEVEVKNIARPVRAFRVSATQTAVAALRPTTGQASRPPPRRRGRLAAAAASLVLLATVASAGGWWWLQQGKTVQAASVERMAFALPEKPSIAVLPFDNLSDDVQQAYFADGLTDDLITDLSKFDGLFVIARNSSFSYRERPVKVQQVAEELGVRYVIEGSVRRAADQVRINVQLIDALTGRHVWAERYDGSLADVFELQDRVIGQIVAALAVSLGSADAVADARTDTDLPEAYDAFLQGLELYQRFTPESHKAAIGHFERAIALDPGYGRAHAGLAAVYWAAIETGWEVAMQLDLPWQEIFDRAKTHLAKAMAEPSSLAYRVSVRLLLHHKRFDEAVAEIDRAIALDPNDADNYIAKSEALSRAGRAEEAETAARTAMRLNPHYRTSYLVALGRSLFGQDRFAEAAEVLQRAALREPNSSNHNQVYQYLAAAYGHLGRSTDAEAALAQNNRLANAAGWESLTLGWVGRWLKFKHEADLDRLREGLRRAGVPEGSAPLAEEEVFLRLVAERDDRFEVEGAQKIDAAAAKALHERGALFVDVRSPGAHRTGHIPGSVHLDLYMSLSPDSLGALIATDDPVVFYCFGEACYRSAHACAKALTWGFSNVYYFASGYPGWIAAGYAGETGGSPAGK